MAFSLLGLPASLWIGRTRYTFAVIFVWRWRGTWRHRRLRLA